MQFTLTYDNGHNSFTYEFAGDNIPETSIISALQDAIEVLVPNAILVLPELTEFPQMYNSIRTEEMSEADAARDELYDEVDRIIEEMYGYAE